jgi:hypothetical protein
MRRRVVAAAVALLGAAAAEAARRPKPRVVTPQAPRAGVAVARVSFAEKGVDRSVPDGRWQGVTEGTRLRTGERLRTGPDGQAQVSFPWMRLSLGPSSLLGIPPGLVLSMSLEAGRAEVSSEGDMIKVVTAEARTVGGGHLVVRRQDGVTRVMSLQGGFRVQTPVGEVLLGPGEGTIVPAAGQPPAPASTLAEAPRNMAPGADPHYVRKGAPLSLTWEGGAAAYHVQVLDLDGQTVLLERDVEGRRLDLQLPWLGTFRWRVAARDARGLEGRPSPDGLIVMVDE